MLIDSRSSPDSPSRSSPLWRAAGPVPRPKVPPTLRPPAPPPRTLPQPAIRSRPRSRATVYDVGDFVMKSMPPGKGGSLSPEEYLAILAFDLSANGIKLDAPLDVEKAKTLEIPRTK